MAPREIQTLRGPMIKMDAQTLTQAAATTNAYLVNMISLARDLANEMRGAIMECCIKPTGGNFQTAENIAKRLQDVGYAIDRAAYDAYRAARAAPPEY